MTIKYFVKSHSVNQTRYKPNSMKDFFKNIYSKKLIKLSMKFIASKYCMLQSFLMHQFFPLPKKLNTKLLIMEYPSYLGSLSKSINDR